MRIRQHTLCLLIILSFVASSKGRIITTDHLGCFQYVFLICITHNMKYISKYNLIRPVPAENHLFKVSNENNRTMNEICSKLTIKAPKLVSFWFRSCVSIVNFEQILHIALVFLLLTLNKPMSAGGYMDQMTSRILMYFAL